MTHNTLVVQWTQNFQSILYGSSSGTDTRKQSQQSRNILSVILPPPPLPSDSSRNKLAAGSSSGGGNCALLHTARSTRVCTCACVGQKSGRDLWEPWQFVLYKVFNVYRNEDRGSEGKVLFPSRWGVRGKVGRSRWKKGEKTLPLYHKTKKQKGKLRITWENFKTWEKNVF